MLALSTSWNADGRYTPGGFLAALRELGLASVELSYLHSARDVDDFSAACRSSGVRIASVHNFCPLPGDGVAGRARSEMLLLSSLDEGERHRAVQRTKRSIATAASVGARVLILHLGRVEMQGGQQELRALYQAGLKESARYGMIQGAMVAERNRIKSRYVGMAMRSIEEICREAESSGVLLGIENRYYFREIPLPEECREILAKFAGGPLAYWHDMGHAQVMQNLGFARVEEYLRSANGKLCGFHIHDVLLCEDHLPPSRGGADFSILAAGEYATAMRVLELSPMHGMAAVKEGIDYLRGMGVS